MSPVARLAALTLATGYVRGMRAAIGSVHRSNFCLEFVVMLHSNRQAGVARLLAICLAGGVMPMNAPAWAQEVEMPTNAPAWAQDAAGSEREVSLPELLAFAERHAPTVVVALQRARYSDAARAGAEPWFRDNPNLQLGVGPRFNGARDRDFDFVASVGQPLEIAGERGLRLKAAERVGERFDAETDLIRWALRNEVVLAYRSAAVARERVALTDRLVRFANELLSVAQKRLAAGDANIIDVRIAQTEVAQTRQTKLAAARDLRIARLRLAEVTGWPIDAPPQVVAGLYPPRSVPSLSAVLASAEERHPELLVRRAVRDEAQARVELADREAWPTPVLGVQVAREGSAGSPANYIVLGTLGVPLNLWQRNQGERAQRRVDQDVARTEESVATRALHARIARAHAELSAASEALELFTSSVSPALEESLTLLQRGFDAGELPLLTVAAARERFLSTQHQTLIAYSDYYRALADLESAVGAELPIISADPRQEAR